MFQNCYQSKTYLWATHFIIKVFYVKQLLYGKIDKTKRQELIEYYFKQALVLAVHRKRNQREQNKLLKEGDQFSIIISF